MTTERARPSHQPGHRPWTSPQAQDFAEQTLTQLRGMEAEQLDAQLHTWVRTQVERVDRRSLNLYAGTNAINPRVSALLASSIGSRPNLGAPGDTYNPGMTDGSRISVLANAVIGEVFSAKYTETRVASGSIANLYVFLATCQPGDPIMVLPEQAAGHVTHHRNGAAGLAGLDVHPIAWDGPRMAIEEAAFAAQAEQIRPKLIVVGGSMCLHSFDLNMVREVADLVGARVLYDAAHMGGLIAGGRFQQPLAEGADVMTGSTYKSFGGPPAGMVLTNDAGLAERLDRIAFPGLTANFDLARTAALALAALDLREHGAAYADAQILTAQALAAALEADGLPVVRAQGCSDHKRHTASHHVALRAGVFGGAMKVVAALEEAAILSSGIGLPAMSEGEESTAVGERGVRFGTQEIVRWGLGQEDAQEISSLIVRALSGEAERPRVAADVLSLRTRSSTLRFVR